MVQYGQKRSPTLVRTAVQGWSLPPLCRRVAMISKTERSMTAAVSESCTSDSVDSSKMTIEGNPRFTEKNDGNDRSRCDVHGHVAIS